MTAKLPKCRFCGESVRCTDKDCAADTHSHVECLRASKRGASTIPKWRQDRRKKVAK